MSPVPIRYGAWLACFVVVLMVFLQVRIEVHQLRKDLDRTGTAIDAATDLNHQLVLELDARKRFVEAERHAVELGLTDDVTIVEAPERPRAR